MKDYRRVIREKLWSFKMAIKIAVKIFEVTRRKTSITQLRLGSGTDWIRNDGCLQKKKKKKIIDLRQRLDISDK